MAKIFIYDKNNNIVDQKDSAGLSLDQFLEDLVSRTTSTGEVSLRIDECFDGSNSYFNVMFVPNVLRTIEHHD